MIYTRASDVTFGAGYAAGNYHNFLPIDMRSAFSVQEEMRLVRISLGTAARQSIESPGITTNLDHNVLAELVRVTISASGLTTYGTTGTPTERVANMEPNMLDKFCAFINDGFIGTVTSAVADPNALWRTAFQIRRGVKKRWSWQNGLRMGIDRVSGLREGLVLRMALMKQSGLPTTISYALDFATAAEDVANLEMGINR